VAIVVVLLVLRKSRKGKSQDVKKAEVEINAAL
jgi:hypothetical protein